MAYIGNIPAESYASFETETFSVSATTNYTLSHAVTNENEIRLVINGVVQQPGSGKAYTASGTTLTLTSATVSGDSMYAVYLGRALQTVNPPNASVGTAQLADSSVTSAKLASGAVANTPYFHAYNTSSQTLNNSTETKKTFTTKIESASGVFDLTNNKFVCVTAGTYLFSINLYGYDSDNNLTRLTTRLKKNGNRVQAFNWNFNSDQDGRDFSVGGAWLEEAAVDDYFEMYAFTTTSDSGSILLYGSSSEYSNYFSGFKLIG